MEKYYPGVFATSYNTAIGEGLWKLLNDPENILRMETASSLGRPAVEGIEEPLLEAFGEDVMDGRVKQMVGHMARQVMERRGYVIDVQNVKVSNGAPFSRATRYRRPDEFTFHVFRTSKNKGTYALTGDKRGSSLPKDQPEPRTRWTYWKSFRGGLRGRIAFGLKDEAKARADIARQGFHIYRPGRMLRAGK